MLLRFCNVSNNSHLQNPWDSTNTRRIIRRGNPEIDETIMAREESVLNTVLRHSKEQPYFQSNTIPVTQSSIQALHKFRLQQQLVGECFICMEEFPVDSVLTHMPCSHVYHGDSSHFCPLCRYSMPH